MEEASLSWFGFFSPKSQLVLTPQFCRVERRPIKSTRGISVSLHGILCNCTPKLYLSKLITAKFCCCLHHFAVQILQCRKVMPTSSLGQRDVPHVILSCCSFQHHLVPGVDVFKHTKLVKTYKTCHESPPGRRIMDFFFPNFLFYLKEQNQEKRKKLYPSGQRT